MRARSCTTRCPSASSRALALSSKHIDTVRGSGSIRIEGLPAFIEPPPRARCGPLVAPRSDQGRRDTAAILAYLAAEVEVDGGGTEMALKPHLIGGAWVEGSDGPGRHQPLGPERRRRRLRAAPTGRSPSRRSRPPRRRSRPGRAARRSSASTCWTRSAARSWRARRARRAARARGGQDPRRGRRRGGARRPDLQVLRRRGAAPRRRARALGAARASRSRSPASRSAWSG